MSIHPLTSACRLARLSGLLLACLLASSQAKAEPEAPVLDAFGQTVPTGEPRRIVTLGSDVTEIVYALGEGERIVAVDRGSQFPAATASKANVGYRRRLTAEGVASLSADLILAAEDIGPQEAVEVLRELKVPIVFVPEDHSGEGIRRKIEIIARALSRDASGQALAASVIEKLEAAKALTAGIPAEQRKTVVFFHGLIRLTAAGSGTAADAIIKLAGGRNPMDEVSGYKAASEERLVELAPEVILMMGDGQGGPTAEEVFSNRALAATPAGRTRSLIVLDGAYMIGFGPRTADAVRDLATALYGDRGGVGPD
ncbi:ABC transporter substrate-binding protein [Aquibium carbonis]|uniref:ABC transporter substrate-binding protein n=1 Tax=Aquibium carbonis TaxID=2495581 RepID=A0A429Z1B6_9HYPH|nr:ABC transporter substrate-binding protein [Aquibium carbonis]RST87526.1 ABC transporter substrate-binding protein [Aquibium carbonis]